MVLGNGRNNFVNVFSIVSNIYDKIFTIYISSILKYETIVKFFIWLAGDFFFTEVNFLFFKIFAKASERNFRKGQSRKRIARSSMQHY